MAIMLVEVLVSCENQAHEARHLFEERAGGPWALVAGREYPSLPKPDDGMLHTVLIPALLAVSGAVGWELRKGATLSDVELNALRMVVDRLLDVVNEPPGGYLVLPNL